MSATRNTEEMTASEIEQRLREELWLRHGHDKGPALYGDDGEMQCKLCPLWDYRREPLRLLVEQADKMRLVAVAEKMRAAAKKAEAWRCSCKREPQHDTVVAWDPMCELHGEAVP